MSSNTMSGRHCLAIPQPVGSGVNALHAVTFLPQRVAQHRARIQVVIDQQDAQSIAPRFFGVGFVRRRRLRFDSRSLHERHFHNELASYIQPFRGAVCFDCAAVQLDDAMHQAQPDPQPALGSVQRTIGLREQVEDARQEFFIDADAVVAHPNQRVILMMVACDFDAPALIACTWRRC